MNAWALLACYPRRTFYPFSDGFSTQNHRITNPYFRTCSTCESRSQTARQTLSRSRINGYRLVLRYNKGGISRTTPPELASRFQSLPPILHILDQNTVSGYSKGARGLSVLLQEVRIFTNITISPSPSLRQCPSRYTIRAGRNLPDKEFRYLRTVIVTAAVYRGFNSELRSHTYHPHQYEKDKCGN
jgi:hypothetical protein